MNNYKCPHCHKTVTRKSVKQWIESYCEETGKTARLQLVKDESLGCGSKSPTNAERSKQITETLNILRNN